jgi:hypothetical protein
MWLASPHTHTQLLERLVDAFEALQGSEYSVKEDSFKIKAKVLSAQGYISIQAQVFQDSGTPWMQLRVYVCVWIVCICCFIYSILAYHTTQHTLHYQHNTLHTTLHHTLQTQYTTNTAEGQEDVRVVQFRRVQGDSMAYRSIFSGLWMSMSDVIKSN